VSGFVRQCNSVVEPHSTTQDSSGHQRWMGYVPPKRTRVTLEVPYSMGASGHWDEISTFIYHMVQMQTMSCCAQHV
jgi:hypothetical protein